VDEKQLPDEARLAAWRAFLNGPAAIVARIERDLARAGDVAPLPGYDVLIELVEAEGNRLRQRDLARRVVLTRSGISRLVDRLVTTGLVRREPNPADRRGGFIALTDAGHAALRRTWPAYARGIQEHFARFLSEDEARVIAAALERARAGDGG
jgi:DNA-binding MarR family transcriptional regulator